MKTKCKIACEILRSVRANGGDIKLEDCGERVRIIGRQEYVKPRHYFISQYTAELVRRLKLKVVAHNPDVKPQCSDMALYQAYLRDGSKIICLYPERIPRGMATTAIRAMVSWGQVLGVEDYWPDNAFRNPPLTGFFSNRRYASSDR